MHCKICEGTAPTRTASCIPVAFAIQEQQKSLAVSEQLIGLQVHCKICKRNGNNNDSFLQRFQTGNMFTHHQKSVILDAEGLEGGPEVDHRHVTKQGEISLALCEQQPLALVVTIGRLQHIK